MKVNLYNLSGELLEGRELELNQDIFGLEYRPDIIKHVIKWQQCKKMAGTHSTKTVSEVSGTTKKPFRQKGTGNARQGSLRSVQMRGGGVSHGPTVRDHAFNVQKKVRKRALKQALSYKLSNGKLIVVDSLSINNNKTYELKEILKKYEHKSFFCIDDQFVNQNFYLASRNLFNVIAVPQIGANVYDIMKHDCVLVTQDAVNNLQKRLK